MPPEPRAASADRRRLCVVRRTAGRSRFALVIACGLLGFSAESVAAVQNGRIAGLTLITYGCPGPQRIGQRCERWFTFARARFALTRTAPDGRPLSNTRRIQQSDPNGSFRIDLPAGTYAVTPLPQAHTRGGTVVTVRVRNRQVAHITIRYLGYPMMA